jgi:hypothetical protein
LLPSHIADLANWTPATGEALNAEEPAELSEGRRPGAAAAPTVPVRQSMNLVQALCATHRWELILLSAV